MGNGIEKANALFSSMKENKIKPSIISYTSLIQMYIRRKRICEAINLFRTISKEGLEIDYVCYNFIINGCTFNKNLEHAINFLLEALEKDIRLSKETYKNVLEYLLNNKFMKHFERKSSASKILTEMKNKNIEIDYDLYSRLMRLVYNKSNYDGEDAEVENLNHAPRKYNNKEKFVKKNSNKKNQFSSFVSLYDN